MALIGSYSQLSSPKKRSHLQTDQFSFGQKVKSACSDLANHGRSCFAIDFEWLILHRNGCLTHARGATCLFDRQFELNPTTFTCSSNSAILSSSTSPNGSRGCLKLQMTSLTSTVVRKFGFKS